MDFKAILVALSGPINAVVRYAVTALGAWVLTKGYFDSATVDNITGGLMMILPAVIGALIDTKSAKVAQVQAMPDKAVVGTDTRSNALGIR